MTAQEIRARFPDLETVTAMFADSNGIMRGKVLPCLLYTSPSPRDPT